VRVSGFRIFDVLGCWAASVRYLLLRFRDSISAPIFMGQDAQE